MARFFETLDSDLKAGLKADAYKPTNMPAAQVQAESGGRQFDSSGRTLVGRRGDGTLPKPSQRAYGIGQIQIATARETAKRHGIPWDEKKLMTDPNYNLMLSDTYKGDLLKYYKGDQTLATAAYHSGPRNVDRAVATHGRQGFTQGLGPDGRKYVKKLTGEGNGSVATSGFKGSSTSTPQRAPSNRPAVGGNLDRAFGLESDVRKAGQQATRASDFLGEVLTQVTQGVQAEQAKQVQIQTERNAQTKVLLDAHRQQTEELQAKVAPIFARQAAIAERRVELSQMNWFERTFQGLFNENYDPDYLNNVDDALKQQVGQITTQYQVESNFRDNLAKALDQEFAGEEQLSKLIVGNLMQNFGLASQATQVAEAQLGARLNEINADTTLLSAQLQAKNQTLSQLIDNGQINQYLELADKNGGEVVLNGVPITSAELIKQSQVNDRQEKEYKLLQLSIQQADQALTDHAMETYIAGLTPAQRATAAQNNYMDHRGQQLNPEILAKYMNYDTQLTQAGTNVALTQMGGMGMMENYESYLRGSAGELRRSRSLMGNDGVQKLDRTLVVQSQQLKEMADRIRETAPGPVRDQLRAQFNAAIGQFSEQKRKLMDDSVKNFTRDKDAQVLVRAWMDGTTVSPEAAVRGFIGLAQGGTTMIPGVDPRAPEAGTIAKMQQAVKQVYDRYGGERSIQQIATGQDKQAKAQLERELMGAVTKAAQSSWVNRQGNALLAMAPKWAKADKHPAGRISDQAFYSAMSEGDNAGYAMIASTLGITTQDATAIFKPGGLGMNAPLAKQKNWSAAQFGQYQAQLATFQTQAMMKALDIGEASTPGFRPSLALADYLKTNGFQARVRANDISSTMTGFGGSIISGVIGQNAVAGSMANYSQRFAEAAAANDQNDKNTFKNNVAQARRNPMERTRATLAYMDIDPASQQILLKAMTPIIQDLAKADLYWDAQANQQPAVAIGVAATRWWHGDSMIKDPLASFMINGHFDDPQAEKIRKQVAPKWQEASKALDRALGSFEGE